MCKSSACAEFRTRVTALLLIASHVRHVRRYMRALTWLSIILTSDKPRGTVGSRHAPRPSAAIFQRINSSLRVTSGDSAGDISAAQPRLCEPSFSTSPRGRRCIWDLGSPRGYAAPNWVARTGRDTSNTHSRDVRARGNACAT